MITVARIFEYLFFGFVAAAGGVILFILAAEAWNEWQYQRQRKKKGRDDDGQG